MSQSIIGASAPIVSISNNTVVTTSMAVADAFGRRHDHVVRDIRNLLGILPKDHSPKFGEMIFDVEVGKGAVRKVAGFWMSRDGFALLAMGFTGRKALEFKLKYIDAFNAMEAQLAAGGADAQREISLLRAALLDSNPVYGRIAQYHTMGLTPAEIGQLLGMHRTTVGGLLRKLHALGLVHYDRKPGYFRRSLPGQLALEV